MNIWQISEVHFLDMDLVSEKSRMLQIGSWPGRCASRWIERYPMGQVVGYEPCISHFCYLTQTIQDSRIMWFAEGLSSTGASTERLHEYRNGLSHSTWDRTDMEIVDTYDIDCVTMREIYDRHGEFDVILMNCEGAEMMGLADLAHDVDGVSMIAKQICVGWHDGKCYSPAVKENLMNILSKRYEVIPCAKTKRVKPCDQHTLLVRK